MSSLDVYRHHLSLDCSVLLPPFLNIKEAQSSRPGEMVFGTIVCHLLVWGAFGTEWLSLPQYLTSRLPVLMRLDSVRKCQVFLAILNKPMGPRGSLREGTGDTIFMRSRIAPIDQ